MSLLEEENNAAQEGVEQQEQGGEETPSWCYKAPSDDNEGVGGDGEAPDWFKVDKYKSIEDQAKAYGELEKRFGDFTGAPESYDLPEGMEEIADDPLFQAVAEIGKESNMGNSTFNKLIEAYQNTMAQQEESYQQQAMEALGENATERIQNVQGWINANLDKGMVDKIVPMATSAESIEVLEHLIGMTKNSNPANPQAVQPVKMSQSEYAEKLMAKDKFGNLKISTDSSYKREMDELAKQFA